MNLSKLDASIAIADRLSMVKKLLTDFDKLTAKAEGYEAELADLKNGETSILKDESRSDHVKLGTLLAIRGKIDLKQAAITALRGEPSHGNNTLATSGKIEVVEQALMKAGEVVSQFLAAFHAAVLVNLRNTIQSTTASFVRSEDAQGLMDLASRHPAVKQLHFFSTPFFAKHFQHGYKEVVSNARNQATWVYLSEVAESVPGELAVSIPDPWLD